MLVKLLLVNAIGHSATSSGASIIGNHTLSIRKLTPSLHPMHLFQSVASPLHDRMPKLHSF